MKKEDFQSDPLKFASFMAHQIQSPLNAVSAALQHVLAEYTGPLQPPQRASLERASARCEQAITSVRRMLAIIRAQAAPGAEGPPAALVTVIRLIHAQYAAEAANHFIALVVDTHAPSVYVRIGEAALAEVLSALVSNAIKYTPDYGRIRLSTAESEREGFVTLSVSDSGVGVPEQDRERIFEPFFRTPAARESARPGVGLGLTFVKSIVTAAGGTVGVKKSELGGAEFTVELPLARAPEGAGAEAAERLPVLRVVIVGGVTAGTKAAAKIIRLRPDADVTIVEKGSVLAYAGCGLPHYVSGVVRDPKRLISSPAGVVRDPVFFRQVKNIHVLNQTEAVAIERAAKRVRVRDVVTGRETTLPYDKLLLATGAAAVVPESLNRALRNVFTLHGVKDAEGIRSALAAGIAQDVVIVGGGLIGIEMTEALVRKGARVTIVEQRGHILPVVDPDMACLVERHLEEHGVRIVTRSAARSLQGDDVVTGVVTDTGTYPADMVILACGLQPNSALAAQAGLTIGSASAIRVNGLLQTSDPDIYAAGDCVETLHRVTNRPMYLPLGSTASRQGRIAAINICGGQETFPGIMGSCICKVFDYCVARTGLKETEARDAGYDVVTVLVPGPDRAHYMPTANPIFLKLVTDRRTRRLLGAQATGPGASDKRIDVAAVALAAEMTVDQIANMDLCYAPQYSTAMDNIITACNVARNKLDGIMVGVSPAEVHRMLRERQPFVFLDVRTPEEVDQVRLPRSTAIPLGALRGRISELPRDQDIVTFCDISLRGYEAALILKAAGFTRVRVMEGGLAMWPYEKLE
jgi:NADPH-dependent 2,4-dienoyl-CoA reductase/sulfur reductase-like enzyme/rhodanese-related sulfurtransferase/two-component sensor histidine kinase